MTDLSTKDTGHDASASTAQKAIVNTKYGKFGLSFSEQKMAKNAIRNLACPMTFRQTYAPIALKS